MCDIEIVSVEFIENRLRSLYRNGQNAVVLCIACVDTYVSILRGEDHDFVELRDVS